MNYVIHVHRADDKRCHWVVKSDKGFFSLTTERSLAYEMTDLSEMLSILREVSTRLGVAITARPEPATSGAALPPAITKLMAGTPN